MGHGPHRPGPGRVVQHLQGRVYTRRLPEETSRMNVKKAVIPAAGLGTRFLPATKAQPKEMLPVLDKPAIQYVVEEALRAGIEDILIISGRGKRSIEDHFDRSLELELYLKEKGKADLLAEVQQISEKVAIHYIRQRDPLGLGHAVSVAEPHVGGQPFACLLGDDIMTEDNPLIERDCVEDNLARVISIVEKPPPEDAPSTLAAIGRYVLTPEIFDALRRTEPGVGGEIQLTDAINILAQEQAVYAYVFEGGRYDIGNKLDWLKATVEIAIDRPDVGPEFREFLADLVARKKLL